MAHRDRLHPTSFPDASLGFSEALRHANMELQTNAKQLRRADGGLRPLSRSPIVISSKPASLLSYAEALRLTRQRFLTTTFLDSEFWQTSEAAVLRENRALGRRIKSGYARRLFLLRRSLDDELQTFADERLFNRNHGRVSDVERQTRRLDRLRERVRQLQQAGCSLRVHPGPVSDGRLPAAMEWDPMASELAIYDRKRVDIFRVSRAGTIELLRSFTKATRDFETYILESERFFDSLWADASCISLQSFLSKLDERLTYVDQRIDYVPNWLIRYNHRLPAEDVVLIGSELKAVESELRDRRKWGSARLILDVGTCTARYPFALRGSLGASGRIVGIDNDPDCETYARKMVIRSQYRDKITILNCDFTAPRIEFGAVGDGVGQFDVITCMMGTLAHFVAGSRDRRRPFNDRLQLCLRRCRDLLSGDGVLFLGVWSDWAIRHGKLLSIYSSADIARLVEWSPASPELTKRLRQAELRVSKKIVIENRLDVYVCAPMGRRSRLSVEIRLPSPGQPPADGPTEAAN